MGRFLSLSAALLAATTSVFAAPLLIYCEDASQNAPGAHPPCTTVTPSKLLEIPLPIQTSILMAFAPNMQFTVPPRPVKAEESDDDDTVSKTEENLPSFPTNLMPLLDFLERGSEDAGDAVLAEPPHEPISEGPYSSDDGEPTLPATHATKKYVLHYLLYDLRTMPAGYIIFALVGVTLLAFLLGEACELCRSRLARRKSLSRYMFQGLDRDEKTKL